jgi:hypothetical protein
MSRADSIRQTASIARCVSGAVTAADHTIFTASVESRGAARKYGLPGRLPASRSPIGAYLAVVRRAVRATLLSKSRGQALRACTRRS